MAKVHAMQQKQTTPLSATDLQAFFFGSDAEKVSDKVAQAESSRINYLFRKFEASDVSAVKEAVKGLKKAAEDQHGSKSAQHKTAAVRGSEVQTLYGAWRFAGFKADGMGYHKSVDEARNLLKSKAIRWTGEKVPEKWEREVRKNVENEAQAMLAVEMEREAFKRKNNGAEPTEEQLQAIRQATADGIKKSGAIQMARKLFEKQGPEFCGWLIESLEAIMADAEQVRKEQEKADKQKAA